MNDLLRRQRALEKTAGKYRGKAIDWKTVDCVRMGRSHLVQMGHKKLPKLPQYRSAIGAKRALKDAGYSSLEAMLDQVVARIPEAHALPGDIVLLKGEGGLESLAIKVSARKVLGWHADHEVAVVMTPHEVVGSWRA